MRRVKVELVAPHPAQQKIIAGAQRYNAVCCGRRTGKTVLGENLAIEAAVQKKQPCGWFAPHYKYLVEPWLNIKRKLAPLISRVNEQEKRIELVNGAVIEAWTMNSDDPARGRKYGRIIVDEAAIAKRLETVWTQAVRATLTDLGGDAWFFSTPKGINFFHTMFMRGVSGPHCRKSWASFQMPTSSNPYIDPAEIEEARRELPELVFRQEYLAEFVDLGGTAVHRDWIRYAPLPDRQFWAGISIGVDLAISTSDSADYTAIVVLVRDMEGKVYVADVHRLRGSFFKVMRAIVSMQEKWNANVVAVEEVQYQAAVVQELLRTTTLPVTGVQPGARDKLVRYMPVVVRYENGDIYHVPGLDPAFEQEVLSFPDGENDDMVDGQGYAFRTLPDTAGNMVFAVGGSRRF